MKTTFSWGDDVIDSRAIIARFDELNDEYNSLVEALEEAESEFRSISNSDESSLVEHQDAENSVAEANESLDEFNSSFDKDELDTLREVVREGENSPDWNHGETLIHESFFETYIEDLINDCYELPKEMNSGQWPYRHLTLDISSAAEEAKQDYYEIEVEGNVYFIRA
jgi:hypothetical protein